MSESINELRIEVESLKARLARLEATVPAQAHQCDELIPDPPIVRRMLAYNIKEKRRLNSLLRLSIQVIEDRREMESRDRELSSQKEATLRPAKER